MTDDLPAEVARLREENARLRGLAAAKPAPVAAASRPDRPVYLRSDLRDAAFFAAHRREILRAASEGRIVDDGPDWKVPGATSAAQRAARKAGQA